MREALSILQAQGLVRIHQRVGAVVFEASEEEMLEAYEIRWALERLALEKAIPKLTTEDLDAARRMLVAMEYPESHTDWLVANNEFHQVVYRASGMKQLCALIESTRDNFAAYFHLLLAEKGPPKHAHEEHEAILRACIERDVELAQKELWTHFVETRTQLQEMIFKTAPPGVKHTS